MTKWIKFNLKRGKTETGVQLLDAKLMDDIHRVTTAQTSAPSLVKPTFPISDITLGYGYGWEVSEYRGIMLFIIRKLAFYNMYTTGAHRGFGDLGRMAIYLQGDGEH